jgi:hypothetical protein
VTKRILYVSADGVLQPLGYSQVLRVVRGLADRGRRYALLSAEAPRDLADEARVARVRADLAEHDVEWLTTRWESGSARKAAANIGRLAASIARFGRVDLVHARCYHASFAAWSVRRVTRAPMLFDTRSYWIDERIEEGRWFTNAASLTAARAIERRLYESARAIVTLTRIQADDLRRGAMGRLHARAIESIPTVCDYEAFDRASPSPQGPWSELRADGPIIAIIGAINASYRTDAMLELARLVLERNARAKLVVLSAQRDEYLARLARLGIAERAVVASASHDEMPHWLKRIDWSISLLATTFAKRASVPTKLAEFFAAGVRPVHHGCNDEVSSWVRTAGSGYVLDALDGISLARCADHVARHGGDEAELERARELTRGWFDLRAGLDRYERVLDRALS